MKTQSEILNEIQKPKLRKAWDEMREWVHQQDWYQKPKEPKVVTTLEGLAEYERLTGKKYEGNSEVDEF